MQKTHKGYFMSRYGIKIDVLTTMLSQYQGYLQNCPNTSPENYSENTNLPIEVSKALNTLILYSEQLNLIDDETWI